MLISYIEKVSEAIMEIHGQPDKEKEFLAIDIFIFAIVRGEKTVRFTLQELADFALKDRNTLNRPHGVFDYSLGNDSFLLSLLGLSGEQKFEETRVLSLLESTLYMLMANNLIFEQSGGARTKEEQIHIKAYPLFSGARLFVNDGDVFSSSFEVAFSDDAWKDYQANRN